MKKIISIMLIFVVIWANAIEVQIRGGHGVQVKRAALAKEEALQAERDNIDKRSMAEIVSPANQKSDRFTQTEAHLFLRNIRMLVEKNYPDTERHLDVVATVIANEAEYKDTHYAFYNTTSNMWRLAQDLYTRLYAYQNPEKLPPKDFKFLRFNDEAINSTAQGFLVKELKEKGLVDDNTETGAIMVSVNLALFGNVGFSGECSWEYFVHPQGHRAPKRETYEKMMDRFGFSHKYVDELMKLVDIYDTKEDTIIQILVPREKIDEIGYLAWVKGIPAHGDTISWVLANSKNKRFKHTKETLEKLTEQFAKEQEKNPMFANMLKGIQAGDFSLDAFLRIYRNKPWEIKEINDVTARLLFTPDVLLNPASGVKFFRFSTVSNEKLKEYNNKLNQIIQKMIAEKESGAQKAPTTDVQSEAASQIG